MINVLIGAVYALCLAGIAWAATSSVPIAITVGAVAALVARIGQRVFGRHP